MSLQRRLVRVTVRVWGLCAQAMLHAEVSSLWVIDQPLLMEAISHVVQVHSAGLRPVAGSHSVVEEQEVQHHVAAHARDIMHIHRHAPARKTSLGTAIDPLICRREEGRRFCEWCLRSPQMMRLYTHCAGGMMSPMQKSAQLRAWLPC